MHFNPRDQIVLLAGLEPDSARSRQLLSRPDLQASVARLGEAGLVVDGRLTDPSGVAAARSLRRIRLDELIAEHLDDGHG
ncbi:MAG: hypothetical protein M0T71_02055 [Actinomycetota bacterium]|nr:hypothetical protein [Actinomycetota bacterium]